MLARDDALAALAAEPFDVLVIGGGITGAGVALDAASRGYSVALVEKGDYARGTSSRSSKLIHGGLRYLQNFDLGLVREALLERQLMAALAPHLVRPLPMIVPAFDGARPDRLVGLGLNAYDVMAVDRLRRRRRDAGPDWGPARHRVVDAAEVVELVPALAGREPSGGYLFYDCQTDDVRLVLTVLAEAERFGAVPANRVEAVALTGRGAQVRAEGDAAFEVRATHVVNATGVWADRLRPEELHDEAEVPVIRPSRGTHVLLPSALLPVSAGVIAPAGGGTTVFVLPWLGRTLVGTTDNDYDGDIEQVQPSDTDVEHLLDAVNAFFGTAAGARRRRRRLRGRAPADLERRPAQVGRHLAQGRAVRDVERAHHHHRREADDVAPDGEARGRPDRRARGARRAVPHARDPARDGGRAGGAAAGRRRRGGGLRAARRPLRPRRAGRAGARRRPRRASRSRCSPGHPDLLAEAAHAARREQARTVGDVLLRRTRLGLTAARELCAPGRARAGARRRGDGGGAGLGRRARGGGGGRRSGRRRAPRASWWRRERARRARCARPAGGSSWAARRC